MTECQGCGAWNDASRALCVLCGAPLAEIDEWDAAAAPPPLPPLPDGGLRASMPAWLREPPGPQPPAFPPGGSAALPASDAPPLGPGADPRTFLSDEDFPQWLRGLASRRAEPGPAPARAVGVAADAPKHAEEPAARAGGPDRAAPAAAAAATAPLPPEPPTVAPPIPAVVAVPVAQGVSPVADPVVAATPVASPPPATAARPGEERRGRQPWETLLLAALCIGVGAAALWALVANGVFGPGP